jgi:hypothetical protein
MVRRRFDMRTPRKISGGAGIKSQERKMLNRVLCIAATKSSKPWIDSERKRPSEVFRVKKFNVALDDGHTRLLMKFGLCRCGELHGRVASACEDDGSLIQVGAWLGSPRATSRTCTATVGTVESERRPTGPVKRFYHQRLLSITVLRLEAAGPLSP